MVDSPTVTGGAEHVPFAPPASVIADDWRQTNALLAELVAACRRLAARMGVPDEGEGGDDAA